MYFWIHLYDEQRPTQESSWLEPNTEQCIGFLLHAYMLTCIGFLLHAYMLTCTSFVYRDDNRPKQGTHALTRQKRDLKLTWTSCRAAFCKGTRRPPSVHPPDHRFDGDRICAARARVCCSRKKATVVIAGGRGTEHPLCHEGWRVEASSKSSLGKRQLVSADAREWAFQRPFRC